MTTTPVLEPIEIQSPSKLTPLQLVMMNLGFAGIQMVWGLQMANASSIFESLGARASQIPILWLAAPVSGFVIQPLVGYWSDRTQSPWGKRRPYFFVGGVIGSLAVVALPFSPSLAIAVTLTWVLDVFINVAMTPFRSFVVDVVPEPQRTLAFSTQSFSHGLGAFLASLLPWCLLHLFHFPHLTLVDDSVRISLWIGALVLGGSLMGTILFASPDLPSRPKPRTIRAVEISFKQALLKMPLVMKRLFWVQSLSWMAIFCVFLYFPPAVAHNIFGASSQLSELYAPGIAWAEICLAFFNLICMGVSLILPRMAQSFSLTTIHGGALVCGAMGLLSLPWVHSPLLLLVPMLGLGIAWASMLSIPYTLLSAGVPEELNGLYMGVFNCFITLPQILVSLGLGWFMHQYLGGDRLVTVALGGILMFLAAVQSFRMTRATVISPAIV